MVAVTVFVTGCGSGASCSVVGVFINVDYVVSRAGFYLGIRNDWLHCGP